MNENLKRGQSMNKEFDNEENGPAGVPGLVKIHENVIATIVRRIACGVEGVSKISGSSFVDNIAEMVGSKKMHDRSIIVDMRDSSVAVEVSINLLYGVQLPKVAAAVQEAVAEEITKLTGLKVSKVNIIVREIEDPADESEE